MEYAVGFDPANPSQIDKSINRIGNYSVPKTHELIIGLDRELMANFGVSARVHLPQDGGLQLGSAHRRALEQLPADRHLDGQRSAGWVELLPALLRRDCVAGGRRSARQRSRASDPRRLQSAVHRLRGLRHQAPVEPLDGPLRVLEQPARGVLRRAAVDSGSDAGSVGSAGERRSGGRAVWWQRQERHLSAASALSVHRAPACIRRDGASTSGST